ncbi:859_t:CDS:2 [Racocetra fulgida]|uniref:859_t:CDS:1 n=1 Tax=Racocetra fulgida TaxID=60492 RepID=A0A9N9AXD4_9GLOM|nr:859_t:CDS:2 [Racocetra fulgida]
MSSKRNYRKKSKPENGQENENTDTSHIVENDNVSDEVSNDLDLLIMFSIYSETIEELIELRKFRRRHQGIDAEKLLKGEARSKKKKKDEDPWKLTTGGIVDLEAVREAERMAYIEEEMRKRRGQISDLKNDVEDAEHADPLNPQDELFQAPDHLRIESKPISEGNVQLSTTMLTAIPEVDLGIDDHERNQQETLNQPSHYKPGQRREMATDDIVAERFKKRLRR